MENKKAVLYARVSSDRQEKEGYSIPAQLKCLREYADKNGLSIVKEFTESETAKRAGREQFGNMIKYLKNNPSIGNILVEKTDRLYRNFKDYTVLDDLDLVIHLVKENEVLSKDSKSHQKFIHGIKVLMAKNYSDNLSEEAKKGRLEKVEQGGFPGPAPFGYINNLKEHTIEVNETQAKIVKMMFELYASGKYSLSTLRQSLIDDGFDVHFKSKKLPKQTLARILQSPVYYGMILFHGKLYKGAHQPIISKSLFDDVQGVLAGKPSSKGSKRRRFVYSGLMVCGNCGCTITAEIKKGKYIYYHCTNYRGDCSRKSVNEGFLDNPFAQVIKDVVMDKEKLEWLKEGLIEAHSSEKELREEAILSLENELRQVRERMDKLYIDKVDGKITEDFWQRNNDNWLTKQHELTHAIELHKKVSQDSIKAGIALLDKAQSLYEEFKLMKDIEKKRNILKTLVSNSTLNGSNLVVEYNEPFSIFNKMAKSDEWRGRRDSNSRPHA